MHSIVNEIATGLGGLMLKVFLIVVPLITFLEWAQKQRWFTQMVNSVQPVFRPLGFRHNAFFPLLTGLIFGISYGAGVLIPQARSGELGPKQIFLVASFLCVCHALVEDTLLFVAVGASAWILPCTRFVLALILVPVLARLPWPLAATEAQTETQA